MRVGRELADLRDTRLWVVSRDRTRVATWDGHTVKVLDSAGRVLERRDTALRPIDIVDDDVYLAGDNDAQGWTVVTGGTKAMLPGLVAVSPSRSRAAIVYTKAPDSLDSCWAVVDLTLSRFTRLVEKCGNTYVPTAFSANGTYLVVRSRRAAACTPSSRSFGPTPARRSSAARRARPARERAGACVSALTSAPSGSRRTRRPWAFRPRPTPSRDARSARAAPR